MANANSPLRYPGGKGILTDFLAETIAANDVRNCIYLEPYAGGAGAALNLLLAGKVERICLNDADRCVWSFWHSILHHTDAFIRLIETTPVTVKEWQRQRAIYCEKPRRILELGFAAFFLNRCNRSGIMTNGSVIGGLNQSGEWKINARYNPDELIRRIRVIAGHRAQITASNQDAVSFLRIHLPKGYRKKHFVYLDPPYFIKGSRLYLNYYEEQDHRKLAQYLRRLKNLRWLVTYDNVPEIRELYSWRARDITDFHLQYSAAESRQGSEIIIPSPGLVVPTQLLNVA